MKKWTIAVIFIIVFITAIVWYACDGKGNPETGEKRRTDWLHDIKVLQQELPRKHKNLFARLSEDDYNRKLAELKEKVQDLSDDEIKVELGRIIASIGDGHTVLMFDTASQYPFKLYWFEEGLYIVDTTEEYRHTMNLKLLRINGQDIEQVAAKLTSVIPHENEARLKRAMPSYLINPEVLKGLQIADSDEIELELSGSQGEKLKVTARPGNPNEFNYIGGHEPDGELPLSRRNAGLNYWYDYLEQNHTVYFKYNSCMEMEEKSFEAFTGELFAFIDRHKPDKLVIDLRNNSGGDAPLFDPFLSELRKREYLNDSKKLYVVIGRQTFSSAIINAGDLRKSTKATFIGEPTGGKPNHYGQVKTMQLPQHHITIYYSTRYIKIMDDEMDSLLPDITIYPRFADYIQHRDAVMDTIITNDGRSL